jgi:23S rRNA (pseudouridine1915-N3)-methyltransferase
MLSIHIVTLGRLKETYWQEAEREYLKRLTPYAKVIIHESREESFFEKTNNELVKQKEAEKIKNVLLKIRNAYVVILDEKGKQFSSVQFAEEIGEQQENFQTFIFVIGGPLGLESSIAKMGNQVLSLSSLTFTHQMARIFLLEQLYRSFMILGNRKYHY